nr:hypothetical protein [Tanacetum cinerariifolium]
VVQIVLWYLDSSCSKHMTGDRSHLINFVHKFLGTVKFGNDHMAKILSYGDYQIGNVTISRVYYVEGLGHNLFSVGQFCGSDLEVAFRQHTCFIRNLDMMASSPICLLSKASKTKSWPWHHRLSHLNFACAMGKSTKKTHKPKSEDTNQEKLYLLHMDLCEPMRVESVNGKKYILVIEDDYSRFTSVKFLRSKDETPMFIIKFLKMIQVGISHETLVARSPQQNGVVERHNRTLIEAARTMLIYAQAPLFLWAEAMATAFSLQDVGNDNLDIEVAHMGNDSLLGVPFPEVPSEQSSSTAPHGSSRIKGVKRPVTGIARTRLYTSKCVSMGCTSSFCQEKGW